MIAKLRQLVWEKDIPHPTTPEYKEHHRDIQEILKFIDEKIMDKFVVISKDEYKKLQKTDTFMNALEAAGVDNWGGYSHAHDILRSWGHSDEEED